MTIQEALKQAMEDYRVLTGLRSYLLLDNKEIQSASERNYFCKCLKLSSQALKKCEECTSEYFNEARKAKKECIYSCHAGLIKWAVPVHCDDFHCVIISEGILAQRQKEDAEQWATYLNKEFDLSKDMLKRNIEIVTTMNEEQMDASIKLLKDLVDYHLSIYHSLQPA